MKKHLSLKAQITGVIIAVTVLSTFMAFTFSIIYDYVNSLNDLKNTMQFNAHMMAENCKSPLLFNDVPGAEEILSSFASIPMVQYAAVHTDNDTLFARYAKNNQTCNIHDSSENYSIINKDGLHISKLILQDNKPFGRLVMHVSTLHIKRKFQLNLLVFLLAFAIIICVAYVIALKLQQIISRPILELKNLAEQITEKSDYSLRIPQTRYNEVGLLQASFDTMVQQLNRTVLSLKTEIHDRIGLQKETEHLQNYLNNIIDSISLMIIAVDNEGYIRQVNRETLRFFSGTTEMFLNRRAIDAIALFKEKEECLDQCIRENVPLSCTALYRHPESSQQLNLDITLFPISKTEHEGIVVVINNVTEKNRMESMMVQSEKMASLGGLAAGMAHEINNPLGIISQGVQNALRHLSADEPRNREIAAELNLDMTTLHLYLEKRKVIRYLEGIHSATKRASDIVANMLQFSRMSSQSKAAAKISDVIDQTIELAQNDYELKKKYDFRLITITKEYAAIIPELYCNVTEIQQVILNLLKNAAHALYTSKKEGIIPEITIRIKNQIHSLRIEIEDNGPGIPNEVEKRVFEPFFTTKEVGVGTGLGLSVSFFIITKNHSGTITMETECDKGTKFIIELPFVSA